MAELVSSSPQGTCVCGSKEEVEEGVFVRVSKGRASPRGPPYEEKPLHRMESLRETGGTLIRRRMRRARQTGGKGNQALLGQQ